MVIYISWFTSTSHWFLTFPFEGDKCPQPLATKNVAAKWGRVPTCHFAMWGQGCVMKHQNSPRHCSGPVKLHHFLVLETMRLSLARFASLMLCQQGKDHKSMSQFESHLRRHNPQKDLCFLRSNQCGFVTLDYSLKKLLSLALKICIVVCLPSSLGW